MNGNKPRIGSVVHYVLHTGPNQGEHRPAIVVKADGTTSLQVFADGNPKLGDMLPNCFWRYTVPFDPTGKQIGSWHFAENPARPAILMEGEASL